MKKGKMKNTFKYLLGTLALAGTMVACSPEEFDHMSEDGIVEAVGFGQQIDIQVDQTTNQVTFTLNGANEIYPIWEIDLGKGKTEVSTVNGYKRIFTLSGDYTVRCKIGNKNGISTSYVEEKFHLNNSIVDFTKYTTMLSKAPWYIDNTVKGHLGCGPSGTEGTEWWSANPDEKAAFGVYDNALTFTTDMKYTFDPGAAGTLYANWGVTSNNWQATYWSGVENEDFNVPVELQNTTYNFEVDGDDLYLTFPKGTYFPYIANDDIWNTPRYKVINMTTKQMTLRIDNGGIAWQFILTTQHEVKEVFNGFTYDQPDNLWKQMEVKAGGIYYADGGWAPYPDNGGATFEVSNQETKVVLPLATASQWQAQFPIHTNVGPGSPLMTSAKHYDFSCVVSSNKDLKGMTFKLVETGDNGVPGSLGIAYDANAVFYNNETNLTAFEDYVFYVVDQPGVDIQDNLLQLVLDFGGCAEGTEVTVKNIVLIEHDLNKELNKIPGKEEGPSKEEAVMDWDITSGSNLWSVVESGDKFLSVTPWFSPEGWGGGLTPEWSHEGDAWTVTLPEGMGGSQWMGQFPINTTLTASKDKKYNFYCVLESENDCPGVTIKLVETNVDDTDEGKRDDNFFFADRHDVKAFEPYIYKAENVSLSKDDAHALSLFFDFGGSPVGATVKISKIYFEEAVTVDYNDPNNLWKAVDSGDKFLSVTPWFSPEGWGGGLTPEWNHEGNVWNVTLPEGMGGSQWMGQFPINTTLTAAMDDSYNFSCTIEADNDCSGVTIKLVETNVDDTDEGKRDNNFFFADRHDVEAYEPFVYTVKNVKLPKNDAHALSLFFDFGGSPVGTNVKISNITLIKN